MLEHGDYILLPNGKELTFHNFSAIKDGLYDLSEPGGYTVTQGSIDDIYKFLPDGCKVVMKNFPYAMRKIKPYSINKKFVQLSLFG